VVSVPGLAVGEIVISKGKRKAFSRNHLGINFEVAILKLG
jgi:hypothetical protein